MLSISFVPLQSLSFCHQRPRNRPPLKCCAGSPDEPADGPLENNAIWQVLQRRLAVLRDREVARDRALAYNWRTGRYKSAVVAAVSQDYVRKVAFQGNLLAMGTASGSVVLSDLESGRKLLCKGAHTGQVTALDFQEDLVASAGSVDHVVAVWKCADFKRKAFWAKLASDGAVAEGDLSDPSIRMDDHEDIVTAVLVDAGRRCVYSASADGTVRVCYVNTGKSDLVVRVGEPVLCMLLTEKSYLLLGCASGRVQAYQAESGLFLFSMICHKSNTTAISFCEETQMLATADSSGNIKLWSFKDSSFLGDLPKHDAAVMSLQLDNYKAVSASRDGSVAVAVVDTLQRQYTILGFTKYLGAATFDDVRLFADGTNNVVVCHRFDSEDTD